MSEDRKSLGRLLQNGCCEKERWHRNHSPLFCLLLLFSGLTITQNVLFPLPLLETAPLFVFAPSGVQCLLFRGQSFTKPRKRGNRTACEGVKNRKEGSSETAAASPLLLVSRQSPIFSKALKLFFPPLSLSLSLSLSLWFLSFPSPLTFSVCIVLPPLLSERRLTKMKLFFSEEECWTCQNDIKNGRGNWIRKDVHEILRVIAAARCNVRSVTVIAFKWVRARADGAFTCPHLFVCLEDPTWRSDALSRK